MVAIRQIQYEVPLVYRLAGRPTELLRRKPIIESAANRSLIRRTRNAGYTIVKYEPQNILIVSHKEKNRTVGNIQTPELFEEVNDTARISAGGRTSFVKGNGR